MTSRVNQALIMVLDLQGNGTFQVSMPAGGMSFPLSGGTYTYDDASGTLQVMGVNNVGTPFVEQLDVFEREGDHFHVNYLNTVWELVRQ